MTQTCGLDCDVSSAVQACCTGLGHGTFAGECVKNMSMCSVEILFEQLCMDK